MVLNLSQNKKRLFAAFGFLTFACFAVAGSNKWSLSNDFVQPKLQQAVLAATGLELDRFDHVTLSVLPWPNMQVTNLGLKQPKSRIENAQVASAEIERVMIPLLKARVSFASLVTGKPQIAALTLVSPQVNLAATVDMNKADQLSTAMLGVIYDNARQLPRSLRVRRAVINHDGAEWVKNVELSVNNIASSDIKLRGSADYRNTPIQMTADVGRTASQQERSIRWNLATSSMNAQFTGSLLSPRTLDAEGQFKVSILDGSKLASTLKIGKNQAVLMDGLQLSGQTRITLPTIQVRNAVLERGAERLDGTVELTLDPQKPQFSATLDSKSLNLTAVLTPMVTSLLQQENGWSRQKLSTEWFQAATADIRLSASRLTLGAHTMEHAALSGRMNNGRMEFILSDGRLNGGNVKARSVISLINDTIDLKALGSFDRVDVGAFLDAANVSRLRGQATGQFSFEAVGASIAELVEAAEGRSSLLIKDGELIGIDFERVLGRLERPTASSLSPTTLLEGRTRFQSATAQMTLSGGKMTLSNSWIATDRFRVPLDGTVAVSHRMIDVKARLLPGGEIPKAGDIIIRFEGPWANPIVYPDLTGRLRRS